jgi:hypothetical protein
VLAVGLVAYLLGGLLNASALRHRAESLPLDSGWRDLALAVTGPLESASEALGLSKPGEALDALHGTDARASTGAQAAAFELPVATSSATTVAATAVPATAGAASATTSAPVTSTPSASVPTSSGDTTTTVAPLPTGAPPTAAPAPAPVPPSAARPLRVYVAGDSLTQGYGTVVEAAAARSGVMTATLDVKVASGLNRVDFFDWPARLLSQVESLKPDVVVVTFGANDQQPIVTPEGKAIQDVSDPAWAAEYGRRVGKVMDYLAGGGRKLIWVGTPNDSRPEVTARLAVIRGIFQAEAAKRPGVTFVDTWAYFESPSGGYAAYVADETGEVKRMRANDGFHLSIDGANYLGRIVFAEITKEFQARGGQLPG